MSNQLQLRRGTALQHSTFVGAPGEITYNTDTHDLHAHDGSTPNGFPVGSETFSISKFKAVGDGVSNNLEEITAAIAAANGRVIHVPMDPAGGNYAITSGTLVIPAGQRFQYEGDARIYASGGAISDSGKHLSLMGDTKADNMETYGLRVSANGGNTGPVRSTAQGAAYNYFRIRNDQKDCEAGNGSKVDGVSIDHTFGGGATTGGRHGLEVSLGQAGVASSTSTDRNYVGLSAHVSSNTGDGGTPGVYKGAYFGVEAMAYLAAGCTNAHNCTGLLVEPYIATGASAMNREGIQISSHGTERGLVRDCAISIAAGATDATFKYGMYFNSDNGQTPFGADSTVIKVDPCTVDAIFDFTAVNYTHIFKSSTTFLNDASLRLRAANATVSLGTAGTANTPAVVFSSAGTGSGSDSSITGSGGDGTPGNGNLIFSCALASFNGLIRSAVDNLKDIGTSTLRWANVFATQLRPGAGAVIWTSGTGTPQGVVAAPVGSLFTRTDGGTSTTLYVKETGTNTSSGWVAK